jgi:hypothetical protein
LLHRVVREHWSSFLRQVDRTYARPLPRYVVREFEGYLACGDLTRGFVRAKCKRCGLERAVPFSCKGRGICPSCAGRRMADTAARLVDSVLPDLPLRQWVLSLPYDLRLLAALRPDVLTAVSRIFAETIFRYLRRRLHRPGSACGAVTCVQRAGGRLNLNVHLHDLALDGVFVRRGADAVGFYPAPPPSPADLRWVVETVRRRVLRRLGRMGLLRDERSAGEGSNECPDPSALEACGQLALRSGELEALEDQRSADDDPDDGPLWRRPGRWAAHEAGFDVHAGVRIAAGDHEGRERLVRYALRPAFALDGFTELADGRIAYRVRHPLGPGQTHRVLTPRELIARLAALVPPPHYPLVRYAGVLAGNSPWREFVVPRPPEPTASCRHPRNEPRPVAAPLPGPRAAPDIADPLLAAAPQPVPRSLSPEHWSRLGEGALLAVQPRVDWATLIRRTFLADVLTCPRCRGRMEPIEIVTDPQRAREVLLALGLPCQPVELAPPRDPDDACSRGPPYPPDCLEGVADPPADDTVELPPDDDGCQIVPGDADL